ncbi:iron complex transport system substrate-binding protein [Rosenbergiella nectarea]|uniref:Iron complex transport system substrate-binding protein n=2 Tax=Rosenbergiella nectarea TaxID=988801 RepID=A0A1H9G8V6_9GAMM|nr:iron complex transport system substrate-binding protein [Rosenbergiella nectarea]
MSRWGSPILTPGYRLLAMSNNRTLFTRRRLLQYGLGVGVASILSPSLRAAAPPQPRIAALDWTAVELIDAVGLQPFAVSDIPSYRQWVVTPSLTVTTVELGLRNEPNLELLAQLRPDIIILPHYSPLPEATLQQFGEVIRYPFTLPGKRILTVARDNLQQLGRHLGREAFAQRTLTHWQENMTAARQLLAPWRGKRILLYSFLSPRQVLVMSPSSLFGEVLAYLGLQCAWQGSANMWGSAVIGVEQLYPVDTDIAIEFMHGERGATRAVPQSGLWQKMPFMQQHNHYQVEGAWMYGGLHAALHFTEQLIHLSGQWHD